MNGKQPAAITKIILDSPDSTFHGVSIEPSVINFFYGKNGVGKSTIAKTIRDRVGLEWNDDGDGENYAVLVYDESFIKKNVKMYGGMPGVLTISEQDAKDQELIEEKTERRKKLAEQLTDFTTRLAKKREEGDQHKEAFEKLCWKLTKDRRTDFYDAVDGKRDMQKFVQGILDCQDPQVIDANALARQIRVAFDDSAQTYPELQKVTVTDIPTCELMGKKIESVSKTEFAKFMKAINATTWVRQGHELFPHPKDNKCPYCQQKLPDDFEQQLADSFDTQYEDDVAAIKDFRHSYIEGVTKVWNTLDAAQKTSFPGIKAEGLAAFKEKLSSFQKITRENDDKIKEKIADPAKEEKLQDTDAVLTELNEMIDAFNKLIRENNRIIVGRKSQQTACKKQVKQFFAEMLKDEIKEYTEKAQKIDEEAIALRGKAKAAQDEAEVLLGEITALKSKNVGTFKAVAGINDMLHDTGFQGFSIREKEDMPNTYEVVREDGSIAEHLSEGERHFIAFLYFYYLVKGNGEADNSAIIRGDGSVTNVSNQPDSRDKIVVIDDPVSSMDSGALFVVSSLVREMIEICRSNADPSVQADGDYIKQIFILTHNAYFHKEVAFGQVSRYRYVNYYVITKTDNKSDIIPCVTHTDDVYGDPKNFDPVQNSYTALWMEYKETKDLNVLMNVIRRILEFYFLQLCGWDGANLKKHILIDKKDIFNNEDGTFNQEQYHQAEEMLSYMTVQNHILSDGLNYVTVGMDINTCRDTFELIFDKMGQIQHYNMMMKIESTTEKVRKNVKEA